MRRIPELDATRGLAAIAIVLFHLWLVKYGSIGTAVDLFFVMSGYLITTIILKGMDSARFLQTFYVRRSLRIWPIYYLSLIGLVVLSRLLPTPLELEALPNYLTYTPHIEHYWFGPGAPFTVAFRHTWTLAIEEQFYILWPILLVVGGRRCLVPLASSLIAVSVVARMFGFTQWILIARFDGLALGGLLAALFARSEVETIDRRAKTRLFVLVGLASVAYLAGDSRLLRFLGGYWAAASRPLTSQSLRLLMVSVMYFSAVGLLVVHAGHRWLAPLRDRRLVYLGQISYGIYLYHQIVFVLLDEYGGHLGLHRGPALDLIKLGLTFGIAAASWAYIEKPLLTLKDRFTYRAPSTRSVADVLTTQPRLETSGTGA